MLSIWNRKGKLNYTRKTIWQQNRNKVCHLIRIWLERVWRMFIFAAHYTLDSMKNSLSYISTKLAANESKGKLSHQEISQLQDRLASTEAQMYKILSALDAASSKVQEITKNTRQSLEQNKQVRVEEENNERCHLFSYDYSPWSTKMTIVSHRDHVVIANMIWTKTTVLSVMRIPVIQMSAVSTKMSETKVLRLPLAMTTMTRPWVMRMRKISMINLNHPLAGMEWWIPTTDAIHPWSMIMKSMLHAHEHPINHPTLKQRFMNGVNETILNRWAAVTRLLTSSSRPRYSTLPDRDFNSTPTAPIEIVI